MKLSRTPLQSIIPQYRIYIDEAWRWPLAWPVTVWLILPLWNFPVWEFVDSKSISEKKRVDLYKSIKQLENESLCVHASWRASNNEIDELGIIHAQQLATYRWLYSLFKKLYFLQWRNQLLQSSYWENILAVCSLDRLMRRRKVSAKLIHDILHVSHTLFTVWWILIDWNHTFWIDKDLDINTITIIKWDKKNNYIWMASIVAKNERDMYLYRVEKKNQQYFFNEHKWYWTKKHKEMISTYWISNFHRKTFCRSIKTNKNSSIAIPKLPKIFTIPNASSLNLKKPKLLLHICCAPDLTWPLHRLKEHFHLHLFRYNPNIHPRKEHSKRYEQFLKLVWLEPWDYEILEDWYDPKEFFEAMYDKRSTYDKTLENKPKRDALKKAWEMKERSDRCNPCYQLRLDQASKAAVKYTIPYFSSTLLISPKKHWWKLFNWWLEGESNNPGSKFLWFDFAKDEWYKKATMLTKKNKLRRQQYCWCWWTIPKDGQKIEWYHWW